MASQQNNHEASTSNTFIGNTHPQDTSTCQSDIDATQRKSPAPGAQTGTSSASGGSDVDSTHIARQHEDAVHGNSPTKTTTHPTVAPQSNSGASLENGSENYDPANSVEDTISQSQLIVANNEDSGGSVQSSTHPSRGENCRILNESDDESSYPSGSTLQDTSSWDFFVDCKTLEKANTMHGPRVLHSCVRATGPAKTTQELVDALKRDQDPEERSKLLKQVHRKLHQLRKAKAWTELAAFLPALDDVRTKAIDCLETLLMALRNSQDITVRDQLLQVASISKDVILEMGDNSLNLLPMLTLHFMTLSALLSRCPQPTHDDFKQLAISKKQSKKRGGGTDGLKHMVLKTLQVFHENLDDFLDQAGSLQEWGHLALSQMPREKRRMLFARGANFCEMVVGVFSLLNEVKNYGWGKEAEDLLEILFDVCGPSTPASSTKQKQSEEYKGGLAFFLVRQLALLLSKTFEEEKPEVGKQRCKHQDLITDMLITIAESANTSVQDSILKEVQCFAFHKATYVRKTFSCFLSKKGPLPVLVQEYLAKNLHHIDFQQSWPGGTFKSESKNKVHEDCTWRTFSCFVGKKPAEAAMYNPKASCLGENKQEICLRQHPGRGAKSTEQQEGLREESQMHIKNLDMLKELSPRCKHVLKLYSYQMLPFPMYITEQVSRRRVLDYLLAHRKNENWLNTHRQVQIAIQLTEAMNFLSSRSLDPRGVTGYNTIVQLEPGFENRHQSSDSKCFELPSGNFTVKLAELGLTHQFVDNDPVDSIVKTRPVDDQGPVPVRWLSPEALFEGLYGEKNMVYNLGCLLYELCTHGLQPYSSYDANMSTEAILEKMLTQPGSIELASRPCTPTPVSKLIKDCTAHSPEKRPSLDTVLKTLKQINADHPHTGREPGLEGALSLKKKYLEISSCQRDRHHIPEMGLPKSVQELLLAGKNSDLYSKIRRGNTIKPGRHNAVTAEELMAPDWIRITYKEDRTVVEERMSAQFVRDVLPSLRASDQYGVTCYNRTDDGSPKLSKRDGDMLHTREYPPSVSLETAARDILLSDSVDSADSYEMEESECGGKVLKPLISLARVLVDLHDKHWLAGDLREEHILVDRESGEVMLPRIGRMIRLPHKDTCTVEEVPEDSCRRVGPEVLMNGRYGKENDIYMLGIVIDQVYRIPEIITRKENVTVSRRDFAPYPNIHKDKLADYIRDPNRDQENQPMGCPDWLYDLSLRCRDPDPEKRPTACDVHVILKQNWIESSERTPFIKDCQIPDTVTTEPAQDVARYPVQQKKKQHYKYQSVRLPSRSFFKKFTKRSTHKARATGTCNRSFLRGIKERLMSGDGTRRHTIPPHHSPVVELDREGIAQSSDNHSLTVPDDTYFDVFPRDSRANEANSTSLSPDQIHPLFPSEIGSKESEQTAVKLYEKSQDRLETIEETNRSGSLSSDFSMKNHVEHNPYPNNQRLLCHPIAVPPRGKPDSGDEEKTWIGFYQPKALIECEDICSELYTSTDDVERADTNPYEEDGALPERTERNMDKNGTETELSDKFEEFQDDLYDKIDDSHGTSMEEEDCDKSRKTEINTEKNDLRWPQNQNSPNQSTGKRPQNQKYIAPKEAAERICDSNQTRQETSQCQTKPQEKITSRQCPPNGMPSTADSGKRLSKKRRKYPVTGSYEEKSAQGMMAISKQRTKETLDDYSRISQMARQKTKHKQSRTSRENDGSRLSLQDSTSMPREEALSSSSRYYPEEDHYSKLKLKKEYHEPKMSGPGKSSEDKVHSKRIRKHKVDSRSYASKVNLSEHQTPRDSVDSVQDSEEYPSSSKHSKGTVDLEQISGERCGKAATSTLDFTVSSSRVPKKTFASKQSVVFLRPDSRDAMDEAFRAQMVDTCNVGDEENLLEPSFEGDHSDGEQPVNNTQESLNTVPISSAAQPSIPVAPAAIPTTPVSVESAFRPSITAVSVTSTVRPKVISVPTSSTSSQRMTAVPVCSIDDIATTASVPPSSHPGINAGSIVSSTGRSLNATPVTPKTCQSETATSVMSSACQDVTAASLVAGADLNTSTAAIAPPSGTPASASPSVCESLTRTSSINGRDRHSVEDVADGSACNSNWNTHPSVVGYLNHELSTDPESVYDTSGIRREEVDNHVYMDLNR